MWRVRVWRVRVECECGVCAWNARVVCARGMRVWHVRTLRKLVLLSAAGAACGLLPQPLFIMPRDLPIDVLEPLLGLGLLCAKLLNRDARGQTHCLGELDYLYDGWRVGAHDLRAGWVPHGVVS